MIISLLLIFHLNLFVRLFHYRLKLSPEQAECAHSQPLRHTESFPQAHREVKQHSLGTHYK